MDTSMAGHSKVTYEISAVVIRADGTTEDLGVITATDFKLKPWKRVGARYRIMKANRNHRKRGG